MATYSFPAVAIFDSTATGRSLITAADQAAAQAAIGIDPSDYGLLDSNNTWTGDNTFDEPITASELAGTSSLTLTAGGGSPTYFKFGSTLSWIVDSVSIRPTDSLGSRDIGIYNRRIGDVMAFRFGATESMTIYKVGNETETTNTETLETKWDSTKNSWVMRPKYSGSGTYRDFAIESSIANRAFIKFSIGGSMLALGYGYHYTGGLPNLSIGNGYVQIGKDLYPATSVVDTLNLGKTTNRWGLVASVDADLSGTLTVNQIQNSLGSEGIKFDANYGYLTDANGASNVLRWGSGGFEPYQVFKPRYDETIDFGATNRRWVTGFFVNLDVKTNFSLFNLGETGNANTEYLGINTFTNAYGSHYLIRPHKTGTGGNVRMVIAGPLGEGLSNLLIDQFGITHLMYGNTQKLTVSGSYIRLDEDNIRMSLLPTTIPTSEVGRLWNNGGVISLATDLLGTKPSPTFVDGTFSGTILAGDGLKTAPAYSFSSQSTMGIHRAALNQLGLVAGSSRGAVVGTTYIHIGSSSYFAWRSADNIGSGVGNETRIARDGKGIVGLRTYDNSPNAFRVYGDYTDASNGAWLQMDHGVTNPTRSTIASMANGTGTVRTIDINYGTSVRFKGDSAFSYIYGSSGGYIFYGANKLRGQSGISIDIGESTNRFANGYFVAGDFSGTLTTDLIEPTTDLTLGDSLKNTHIKGAFVRLYDGANLQLNIDSSYCTVYGLGIRGSHDNTRPMGYESRIWSEVWQGKSFIRGSYIDGSNYGYLSIEPDGNDYLIKANSLGTTADAGIKIQTSQLSAGGNKQIVLDADYNGVVSFYFGGNNRGYWGKSTLQANVQVATNTNFVINRTWNNAATVFQGFDANITDTASDANSNLLNLKVSGVQKFRVKKDGTCTATAFVGNGSGLTNLPAIDTGNDYTWTGANTFEENIVMESNVDFTGLPTTDPNTAGRLYNDSGTIKISSGGTPPP